VQRVALTLLLAFTAACQPTAPGRVEAPADSAAEEVAIELAGLQDAAVVVPVEVNGSGPFDFILDTGATLTCVDSVLGDSLALPERGGLLGYGVGAGGSGRMRFVQVDSLRVGAARAEDLAACVLDLEQVRTIGLDVDGLLGLNFLKSFRVTLDFEREVLILQEPEPTGAE
jgi:predicted aspartyl protease